MTRDMFLAPDAVNLEKQLDYKEDSPVLPGIKQSSADMNIELVNKLSNFLETIDEESFTQINEFLNQDNLNNNPLYKEIDVVENTRSSNPPYIMRYDGQTVTNEILSSPNHAEVTTMVDKFLDNYTFSPDIN